MELSSGVWMALMLTQIGYVRTQFNSNSNFLKGTGGSTVCPFGYQLVTDRKVCENAVTRFFNVRADPQGCLEFEAVGCVYGIHQGKPYVFFNNCENGKGTGTASHHAPVCKSSSAADCKDDEPSCPDWAKDGYCQTNYYVKKNCKKSCKVCKGGTNPPQPSNCKDDEPSCPDWAKDGYCQTNYYVKKNCKKSCKVCKGGTNPPQPSNCKDDEPSCPDWAKDGYCQTNYYVKKNCKKSCKVCKGGTNPPQPSNGQCGVQTHKTGRIVGGKNAEVGEWGWQVGLYFAGSATPGNAPWCGGTLIHDNVVMTAAHCFDRKSKLASNYAVRIGDHNWAFGKIGPQEERVGLSKMYIHENYNSFTMENDIALLILNKNVKIGGQVQVACLPTKPVADNAICYATGWGDLKWGGRNPKILQEVELPLYTNSDCKRKYKISEDMICAGYHEGRKDACQGDSGGPLVCKIPGTDRMELRGVTSFGDGCAKPNAPGVYSRVHHFVKNNWIKNKLRQHRMDTVENEINDLESIFEFFADAL